MARDWDVIIIGSGMGGLSSAALLARTGAKRVLVLEKHSEPGGFTHAFRRDGASWDVGLHYVGGLEKGNMERKLFDFITGGALDWNRMPYEFERFVYPGFSFSVPSDQEQYRKRLIARYPDEAAAITAYFRDIDWAARWHISRMREQMMPPFIAWAMSLRRRLGMARATQTTGAYLDRHFRSDELKALLASQWGDYGVPPHESAFVLHALVVGSYFAGAWFPAGGAGRIARAVEAVIEAQDGAIRVDQDVVEIVIENGRAVGVRAIDRHRAEPQETIYRAPVIISDAGAPVTFLRLLPTNGEIGAKTAAIRARIAALSTGVSAVSLYVRLAHPLTALGVKGENYWINTSLTQDNLQQNTTATLNGEPMSAFLSFPSTKSGEDRFYTAEIITMLDPDGFAAWQGTESGRRGTDYDALKTRISEGLLRLADLAVPGFSREVVYKELSTPLSIEHFTSHPMGRFYGLAGTPERYRAEPLTALTPIPGLFLTGSDMSSLGIVGAMIGGMATAGRVLGGMGVMPILKQIDNPESIALTSTGGDAHPDRIHITLRNKTALTPRVWRLDYDCDRAVPAAPGQYGKLEIAPYEWRAYSIADLCDKRLTLLISNRTGGDGSHYADTVQPGTSSLFEMPLGAYRLVENTHRKVFVATGTGLAPFLPMFRDLARKNRLEMAELYFGCPTPNDDITGAFAEILPRTIRCFSRARTEAPDCSGRVTKALAALAFDPDNTDFYICGAAAMVAESRSILEKAGARTILTEPY